MILGNSRRVRNKSISFRPSIISHLSPQFFIYRGYQRRFLRVGTRTFPLNTRRSTYPASLVLYRLTLNKDRKRQYIILTSRWLCLGAKEKYIRNTSYLYSRPYNNGNQIPNKTTTNSTHKLSFRLYYTTNQDAFLKSIFPHSIDGTGSKCPRYLGMSPIFTLSLH